MDLNSSPSQILITTLVFGLASLVITTLPFIYTLINGSMKARNGNTPSSSVISVFCIAFIIHTVCCVLFILGIKLLDILNAINESNYLQNKIFSIFWARGEDKIFSLVGAEGNYEEKAAYLQLFMVQTITDWFIILMPLIIFSTAFAYGTIQARKDTNNTDYFSFFLWLAISNIIAFFVFYIWAKIASLALFIPDGADLITKIYEAYDELFSKGI
ncbi:hypothetical protein B0619_07200 [Campylobacter lari]|nr:hypothetical protein [Campylobacter lari]EAK5786992.1 hypothetical protein [Campylobacter lari]